MIFHSFEPVILQNASFQPAQRTKTTVLGGKADFILKAQIFVYSSVSR